MRVSLHQLRRATSAAAVTLAVTLALPTVAFADTPRLSACDDLLVTISPTGTDGDVHAAAVTAQVLVADVPGWESVTWAVADGTDLREVLVLHSDGATRSVGAAGTGTAADVLAVGFCGTAADDASDAEVAAEPDTSTTSIDPEPAPAPEAEPKTEPRSEAEAEPVDDAVTDEATDADDAQHLDDAAVEHDDVDEGTAFGGPFGPTTAPYHDTAEPRQVATTSTVSPTADATSGMTLLAASSAGEPGVMGSAATSDAGHGTALLALFVGAAAALLLLATRRRFVAAVRA